MTMSKRRYGWLSVTMIALGMTVSAQNLDRSEDIEIDAGYSNIDMESGASVFRDGFTLTQGQFSLSSDRARAYHEEDSQNLTRVVAEGDPVEMSDRLDNGQPIRALAKLMDFELDKQIVTFKGDVSVEHPRGNFSGEFVIYDIKNKGVRSGDENKRVRLVIPARRSEG